MNGMPFVGRERELADLTSLLSRARLVTVTGTGGVGKTRLALRAAKQVAARFADGMYAIELSALSDPRLLANTVAARLGLLEQDTASAGHALVAYLRDREVLLVLDTCEHLLDACATLAETLLQETSKVTVLATSRQPLDVVGENLCPVGPLRVPADIEKRSAGDAVELFSRSAARTVPGFAVTAGNQRDVVALCRRLDGLPLAIELATAQLRSRPLREIVSRTALVLAPRPAAGTQRVPGQGEPGELAATRARHESLDAAIGWSYGLCTDAEQALWERLSVFAGTFGIEAAEEVCAGASLPEDEVLTGLISLVDKSVLIREYQPREARSQEDGPARYRMLDTIREFGAAKLAASGAGDGVRARLLGRYLAKARYFTEHVLDDDQLARLQDLRVEHDSIRAALEWGLGSPDAPRGHGTGLAQALFPYWHATGLYQEGMYWLGRALEEVGDPSPERAAMLGMRCGLGTPGGWDSAIPDGRAAVAMADESGDERIAGRGRLYLLSALTFAGEFDEALAVTAEADRLLKAAGDSTGLVWLAVYLANLHQLRGDFATSLEWSERGIAQLGRSRERWVRGWLYLIAGYSLAQTPGRQADADAAFRLAIQAKFDMGDLVGVAFALEAFALLAVFAGHVARAIWLIGAAAPLWRRAGARLGGNPTWESLHATLIAEHRDRFGADEFDELFAAGGSAPLRQAVTFAAGDAIEPPGQRGDAGPGPLTRREREIASLAAGGLSPRDIAERLVISKRTVDAHLDHIYTKLGISSRTELVRWASD